MKDHIKTSEKEYKQTVVYEDGSREEIVLFSNLMYERCNCKINKDHSVKLSVLDDVKEIIK